jgi:Flp pilus assembly protein TadG
MWACNPIPTAATRIRRRLRQERGQSLVEFAIILPVLLMIIMGILYFGRFEDYANQGTQLAEIGARLAAVDFDPPATTTLDQYILSQAQPELQTGSSDVPGGATVLVYYPTSSTPINTVGQSIRACVFFKMNFPTAVGTPSTKVVQTATMRIEQVQTPATVGWTPDSTSTASADGCPIS